MREVDASGSTATYASLGGKGAYRKGVGLIHDHQKSFRDGMLAIGSVAGAYYGAANAAASETTKQVAARQSTKQIVNASNNATTVRTAEIAADITKSTFVAP